MLEIPLNVPMGAIPASVRVPGVDRTVPWFRQANGQAVVRVRTPRPGPLELADEHGTVTQVRIPDHPDEVAVAPGIEVAPGGRYLQTLDGRPFLWLADTWWFAFSDRVGDGKFEQLAQTRAAQGFSVIQLCAGLYPEVSAGEPLAATAGHWPWHDDEPDAAWWDAADRRIVTMLQAGLVPAVVAAWSYYLLTLGEERLQRHWREIVARWSAFPAVWVIAGEMGLPDYDDVGGPDEARLVSELVTRWTTVVKYVRDLDPYRHPVTAHPCPAFNHYSSTDVLGDRDLLDLVLLQTGHADRMAVPTSLRVLRREIELRPARPVINSEVCYEGIAGGSNATLQRYLFWSHLLSGAAGHSYGAHGLWAFREVADDGPGAAWGDTDWRTAFALPGAAQLGLAARLLGELEWQLLRPDPAAVTPGPDDQDPFRPIAARTGGVLLVYCPSSSLMDEGIGITTAYRSLVLHGLGAGRWRVRLVDPRTGRVAAEHNALPSDGDWPLPAGNFASCLPNFEDWLIIAEAIDR